MVEETPSRVIRAYVRSTDPNDGAGFLKRTKRHKEIDQAYSATLRKLQDRDGSVSKGKDLLASAGPVTVRSASGATTTIPAYDARSLAAITGDRVPLTPAERLAILKRDRFRCRYCGCRPTKHHHIDHVVPVICGGTNDPLNLVTSCRKCNLKKGAQVWTPRPL